MGDRLGIAGAAGTPFFVVPCAARLQAYLCAWILSFLFLFSYTCMEYGTVCHLVLLFGKPCLPRELELLLSRRVCFPPLGMVQEKS